MFSLSLSESAVDFSTSESFSSDTFVEDIFDEFVVTVSQSSLTHSVFSQGPAPVQVIEVLLSYARISSWPIIVIPMDIANVHNTTATPLVAIVVLFFTVLYMKYQRYQKIFVFNQIFSVD